MSYYKRLTKDKPFEELDIKDEMGYSHIYKRLQELENKIKNGTLVELPCKVGDMIYFETWEDNATKYMGVKGHKVAGFEINAFIKGKYGKTYIPIKHYLKSVFPTKEEAENKLAEREIIENEKLF